jgi:glycine hydroxymethyltransferase
LREKPRVIFLGTTSYPYFLDFEWMAGLAEKVGAYLVADIAHISALVIAGLHPNPMAWADVVTMTTHKQLRGPRGAIIGVSKKGLAKDPDLAKKIDRAVFPGLQGGPHMETVAGIGVCLQRAKTEEFRAYAQQIIGNAKALETTLRKSGLAVFGTENHLMVVGVGEGRGRIAAEKLEEAGLVVNANSIPWDRAKPFSPSGIRLGTPAVSSLGMKEQEMELIGQWVADLILEKTETKEILPLVLELRKKFEI